MVTPLHSNLDDRARPYLQKKKINYRGLSHESHAKGIYDKLKRQTLSPIRGIKEDFLGIRRSWTGLDEL